MKWSNASAVVERLRADTRLYLPALSLRRGFSSTRVEHLLQQLVAAMPAEEIYFEVGTLEGRTLDAAAYQNTDKRLYACDPCEKYGDAVEDFGDGVTFYRQPWQEVLPRLSNVGCVFYDGDHSAEATAEFMLRAPEVLADESVLVLDDWDRTSVRDGAFQASMSNDRWTLLREMPEYTDGLSCPPNHFGWYFGVSLWGFRRKDGEYSGDWADFHAGMLGIGKEFRPESMLDLGCGFFIGFRAVVQSGALKRYLGVDVRPYSGQVENLQAQYPDTQIEVVRADVAGWDVGDQRFDLVSVDAHGTVDQEWLSSRKVPNEQDSYADHLAEYYLVTKTQCETAKRAALRIITVDDCCIPAVAEAAIAVLGEPTRKLGGRTGLWHWSV